MRTLSDRAAEIPSDSGCLVKRTPSGIILSCLATLLICAWASVHPNVPPKKKGLVNKLTVVFWMIFAPELVLAWAVRQFLAAREIQVIFNENTAMIPRWRKWTMMHGHFLAMGGLSLVSSDVAGSQPLQQGKNTRVVTFEVLQDQQQSLFKDNWITDAEIEDRFKSEALSKIIAVFQFLWFIVQCIARKVQGLSLTELELVTVTLASVNYFTSVIWANKPKDVKEPVRIYSQMTEMETTTTTIQLTRRGLDPIHLENRTEFAVPTTQAADVPQESEEKNLLVVPPQISTSHVISEAWMLFQESIHALYRPCLYFEEFLFYTFVILPLNICYIVTFPIYLLFPLGIVLLLHLLETNPKIDDNERVAARMLMTLRHWWHIVSLSIRGPFGERFRDSFRERGSAFFGSWFLLFPAMFFLLLLFVVLVSPLSLSVWSFSFVFHTVFGIISTSTVHRDATHVPTFYAPKVKGDSASRMVVFFLFGVAFNLLSFFADLKGWNLVYATAIEKTLWRVTSIALTTIPFVVAPIDYLLENFLVRGRFGRTGKLARDGLDLIMTTLLVVYVPARLFLIAQAFVLLKDQPTKALLAVDWTKYIPHSFS